MLVKRGIAVSPGVASAPALVLGRDFFSISRKTVRPDAVDCGNRPLSPSGEGNLRRDLDPCRRSVRPTGGQVRGDFPGPSGTGPGSADPDEIVDLIGKQYRSPESAVQTVLQKQARALEGP